MASSSARSEKGLAAIPRPLIPFPLRERLGREATDGFVQVLDERDLAVQEQVLNLATERFGRMLAEETGRLRAEFAGECGTLRAEFRSELAAECGKLRVELAVEIGRLRAEVAGEIGKLRAEVATEIGKLRAEMAGLKSDLLKWAFLFWIGQVGAVAGVLALLLRGAAR